MDFVAPVEGLAVVKNWAFVLVVEKVVVSVVPQIYYYLVVVVYCSWDYYY